MSFLEHVDETTATGEARRMYDEDLADQGYIANYTKTFAVRPAVNAAWEQLIGSVRANLDQRRYEVITLGAAQQLKSSYCSLAHGKILAGLTDDATVIDLTTDRAGSDPVDVAIFELSGKIAADASALTAGDLEPVRAQGLSDSEILDIILATAARCFFSTVLDATGTLPDAAYRSQLSEPLLAALTVGRPIDG